MKFIHLGLNTQQVIDGLQEMHPRSDWEKELIEAAILYVGAALEKGNFTKYMQVGFTADESRKGYCPVCNAKLELDGGIDEVDDEQTCEGWSCPQCRCCGLEYRKTTFNGHVVKVLTDEGQLHLIRGKAERQ